MNRKGKIKKQILFALSSFKNTGNINKNLIKVVTCRSQGKIGKQWRDGRGPLLFIFMYIIVMGEPHEYITSSKIELILSDV